MPKERISLSMIDYAASRAEDWETSAFLKKNRHILFVFYEHDNDADSPLDCVVKCVGRWTIPDECLPVLEEDWRLIKRLLTSYGGGRAPRRSDEIPGGRQEGRQGRDARTSVRLQAAVRQAVHPAAHQLDAAHPAAALRRRDARTPCRGKSPPSSSRTSVSPQTRSPRNSTAPIKGHAKSLHADITKAIIGVDPATHRGRQCPDRQARLRQGQAAREHLLPGVQVPRPCGQTWESSDLQVHTREAVSLRRVQEKRHRTVAACSRS